MKNKMRLVGVLCLLLQFFNVMPCKAAGKATENENPSAAAKAAIRYNGKLY